MYPASRPVVKKIAVAPLFIDIDLSLGWFKCNIALLFFELDSIAWQYLHNDDFHSAALCVWLQNIMGNAESVVVQKRLARFRPEERPVVEGVFDKLQGGAGGAAGKTITLEMLQVWLWKQY